MAGRVVLALVGACLLGWALWWLTAAVASARGAVDAEEHEDDERISRGVELAFTYVPPLVVGYFGGLALTYALAGSIPAWAGRIAGGLILLIFGGMCLVGGILIFALLRSNA